MKKIINSLLRFLHFKCKLGETIYVSGYRNCNAILNDAALYQMPQGGRACLFGDERKLLSGAAGLIRYKNSLSLASVFLDDDLAEYIPRLVKNTIENFMSNQSKSFDWSDLHKTILQDIVVQYIGLPFDEELDEACVTLSGWLFDTTSAEGGAQLTSQALAVNALLVLEGAVTKSLTLAADKKVDSPHSVVARVLAIRDAAELSDIQAADIVVALLVSIYPRFRNGFDSVLKSLKINRRIKEKIYQAASAGRMDAITGIVAKIEGLSALYPSATLIRIASKDHVLTRAVLPDLDIKKGDRILLLLNCEKLEEKSFPERVASSSDQSLGNDTSQDDDVYSTFTRGLMQQTLSTVLMALLATNRIQSIYDTQIILTPLPSNLDDYHFDILGSSPPWAVGEEKAWLFDSYGVLNHIQVNVLSVKEVLSLLLMRKIIFYDASLFYVAYDKKHHVLLGSAYAGGGLQTVEMGDQFHRFSNLISQGSHKPASSFNEDERYLDCFDAYSAIRSNYYTWAYFSAFLDKGYGFVFKALLLFREVPGFRKLTPIGVGLLVFVVGLVALLQALPFVNKRINNLFSDVVAGNIVVIRESISVLDSILADGRPYIFGDEFSAADIHICANLANLIAPAQFHGGDVLPSLEDYPQSYRAGVEEFRQTLTGQYVLRVYKDHRLQTR